MSISSSPACSVLVEGQGEFVQPPSDNYDLPLDPYQAANSFAMPCVYVQFGSSLMLDYAWAKDGVTIQPNTIEVGGGVLATVPVPNGDYDSSVEGTYTCSVSLAGNPKGSRNIIVTLPGKPACTSPTSHIHSQVVSGLLVGS